eukprot:TRINITY_DN10099_c0_g1_i3.p1 TRINITY_DN10099_c0_g1~~TRINITY_DN10099_c0_g1_i3.p1  ORF type:complete len:192 (-),score=52.49 TRINITY_DN10099_c0_g1_i3:572-1147(-)
MTEDQIRELVDHQMALSAELNQQLEEEEQALREEEEAYFQASRIATAKRKADAMARAAAPEAEPRSASFDEVTSNFANVENEGTDPEEANIDQSLVHQSGAAAEAEVEAEIITQAEAEARRQTEDVARNDVQARCQAGTWRVEPGFEIKAGGVLGDLNGSVEKGGNGMAPVFDNVPHGRAPNDERDILLCT